MLVYLSTGGVACPGGDIAAPVVGGCGAEVALSGFLTRLLARPEGTQKRSFEGLEMMLAGNRAASGVHVTEEGALRYGAVYACVRVLAETVASLPLITYQRQSRGKERAPDFYLYELLHDRPNPLMTSFEYREAIQGHLALWGNGYSEIEYASNGRVGALWPLRPDKMEPPVREGDGLIYTYQLPNGKRVKLPGWRVWHLRGLSPDGITGYSPIALQRQSIGLGLAAEEFGARLFGNDARPGGVLQHPGMLDDEAYERIRGGWESRHGGLSKSHRTAILEEGMTYQQIGIPPEDAQFLETRKFERSEVAGWYRVPPHMIGDMENATFSNIEHQGINFVVHTMRPWLVRWEQAINLRLLTEQERRRYFAEFLVDGLLRGDIVSRYQAYAVGRQNGWLSADDIRELENMNPLAKGGDTYLVPLNMIPASEAQVGRGVGSNLQQRRRRERRSEEQIADDRQELAMAHVAVFEDTMGRVCRRQAQDVGAAARKFLHKRSEAELILWLSQFWTDHEEWMTRAVGPLYQSYGQVVGAAALLDVDLPDTAPPINGRQIVDQYVATFVAWHIDKSQRKIDAALRHDDQLTALEAAVGLWTAEWPNYLAVKETVQAANGISVGVYKATGVTELRWTNGTRFEPCIFCKPLNGKVVGIEGTFQPDDLPDFRGVQYPPLHQNCWCSVVPAYVVRVGGRQ